MILDAIADPSTLGGIYGGGAVACVAGVAVAVSRWVAPAIAAAWSKRNRDEAQQAIAREQGAAAVVPDLLATLSEMREEMRAEREAMRAEMTRREQECDRKIEEAERNCEQRVDERLAAVQREVSRIAQRVAERLSPMPLETLADDDDTGIRELREIAERMPSLEGT